MAERKQYDKMCHTHAYVKCLHEFGPMLIALADVGTVNKRVWLHAGYEAFSKNGLATPEELAEILLVTDGVTNGFVDGACIISVPEKWCIYCTDEEARSCEELMHIDNQMLGWARG